MAGPQGKKGKKKRDHKVSRGEHGGGGITRLLEHQRPASLVGGIVARFKPIGSINHTQGRP